MTHDIKPLVERLRRRAASKSFGSYLVNPDAAEAADKLEALQGEVVRLVEELEAEAATLERLTKSAQEALVTIQAERAAKEAAEAREAALIADNQRMREALEACREATVNEGGFGVAWEKIDAALLPSDTGAKCETCDGHGAVGFPPDDYGSCPDCLPSDTGGER